jgi:hypothetical protein
MEIKIKMQNEGSAYMGTAAPRICCVLKSPGGSACDHWQPVRPTSEITVILVEITMILTQVWNTVFLQVESQWALLNSRAQCFWESGCSDPSSTPEHSKFPSRIMMGFARAWGTVPSARVRCKAHCKRRCNPSGGVCCWRQWVI